MSLIYKQRCHFKFFIDVRTLSYYTTKLLKGKKRHITASDKKKPCLATEKKLSGYRQNEKEKATVCC